MTSFAAGVDGVTFESYGARLLGAFYRGAGQAPRPTAVLLHGVPGVEKHLVLAYGLRDRGWNCLCFHPCGSWGSGGTYSMDGLVDDTRAAVDWTLAQPSVDPDRLAAFSSGGLGGIPGGQSANRGDVGEVIVNVEKLCLGADRAGRDDQIGGGHGPSLAPQLEADASREVEVSVFQREPAEGSKVCEQCSPLLLISREPDHLDEDDAIERQHVVSDCLGHGFLDRG
jgi:hypothetical protein